MTRRMTGFTRLTTACLSILLIAEIGLGQTPALWGEIKPGPHAVGFRTIEKFDYSRTFQPAKDYFGNPIPGQTARPIQVCYWYPAEPGGTRILYSEYAFPYPSDPEFFGLLTQLQNRELGTIFFFLGNNQGLAQDVMNLEMLAVRDAAPETGTYPLIVYHGGERSAYSQNAVLCEYLASHGFVVASVHTIGMSTVAATMSQSDVEEVVRDKELVAELVREQVNVDIERLGLLGYDYGGSTALLHQMRNYSVDGVATLHGRFLTQAGCDSLLHSPCYSPNRMIVPFLQVFSESGMELVTNTTDSLPYAPRYILGVNGIPPNYFSTYGLMAVLTGADTSRTLQQATSLHSAFYGYLEKFFDACLNGSEESLAWLKNTPEQNGIAAGMLALSELAPSSPPPTQNEFVSIVQVYGADRASELVQTFDLVNPSHPILPDATFTQLGYQFFQRGDVPSSLVVFRWGVTAYPQSANAWDSFGEATAANGNIDSALAYYRKAQEILPSDTLAVPQMRTILETSIPTNITRLEQMIADREHPADSTQGGD